MSSESTGIYALDQYRNISKKLKKTFFKKPNENNALDSYVALAREFENTDLPGYAAICWNGAAKCESSLGNPTGEVTKLVKAARQFGASDVDNLSASLVCYNSAITKCEPSPLTVTLNLEVVDFLERIGKKNYIDDYLNIAIANCPKGQFMKTHCLGLLASNFIETADYLSALNTFTEIYNLVKDLPPSGANTECLLRCEISRVLLLLILKPPAQKLTPDLAKILERYTWGDKMDINLQRCKMNDTLFILLESLVTTCQSADTSSLVDLEGDLWQFLSTEQRSLLRVLVKLYYT